MHRPFKFSFVLAASALLLAIHLCALAAVSASAAQAPANTPPPAPKSTASPDNAVPPSSASATPAANPPAAASTSDPAVDPAAPAKKPKKVWTNEDVSGMRGPISVVGNARNAKSKNAVPTPADPAYIANVRKKLQELRDKMDATDKELATLKDFSEGEPVATADREFHKSYGSQPIAQQIASLQAKKLDLQSKIDALLDEARQKGVEPGQLR